MFKYLKNLIFGNEEQKNSNLPIKYFNNLKEKISRIKVFGSDRNGNVIYHELDRVFVELTILEGYDRPLSAQIYSSMLDEELRRQRSFLSDEEKTKKFTNSSNVKRIIKASELLAEKTHVFVTGAPQCGKTTLLRYLTWQTYKKDHFPLFIELKTIKAVDFEKAGSDLSNLIFQKSIADPLMLNAGEYQELKNYFIDRLRAGEVSFFLDGLDEVREESFFFDLCQLIEDFLRSEFRQNSLVVSARPFALHQTRIEGLKEVEIRPLNDSQIKDFLSYYYGDDDPIVSKINQIIYQQKHIREMARIPFLLTVMVDLLRREQQLGTIRLELYRAITLQLLGQLDKDKKVQRFAFKVSDPSNTIKLQFLKYLAFEKLLLDHTEKDSEVSRLIFTDKTIREKAKTFVENGQLANINFLELAEDIKATSLLREIGDDVYAFAHLTLQEYLAADVLSNHPDCERIFSRAFYNPTLVEMEVLPMTLGVSVAPTQLYNLLDTFSESLILTNLRLKIRGLNYITNINQPEIKALLDRIAYLLNPLADDEGFRKSVLQSLKSLSENARQYLEEKMIPLLKESSITKSKAAEAIRIVGSEKSFEPLLEALKFDRSKDFFSSPVIGFSRFNEMEMHPICRALAQIDPDAAARAFAFLKTSYTFGNIDWILKDMGTEESHRTLLKRRKQNLQWRALQVLDQMINESEARSVKEILIENLNHIDPDIRGLVIETLGHLRLEDTVEILAEHLRDPHYTVRWKTADALGEIRSEKSVEPLIKALESEEFKDNRRFIASALGNIRSKASIDSLIKVLNDPDPQVVENAAQALGWMESDQAVEPLLKVLEKGNQKARIAAAFALGKAADEKTINLLISYLNDRNPGVRSGCAFSLGKSGLERVVAPVVNLLSDGSNEVRFAAAHSLGLTKSAQAAAPLSEILGKDPDRRVQEEAIKSLGEIGSGAVVKPLLERYSSILYTQNVIEALAKLDTLILETELPGLLSHESQYVRRRALKAIGYYTVEPSVLGQIKDIAGNDPVPEIREIASKICKIYQQKLELYDSFHPSLSRDGLSNDEKEAILVGEVITIVAQSRHLFRPIPNSDWGIDGEIEFKEGNKSPAGKRVYLQLKSGDSWLYLRKGDQKEIFYPKKRHVTYWGSQAYPVYLVIRNSQGLIRWMNVSEYINRHETGITQIEFEGEEFNPASINQIYRNFPAK